MSEKEYVVHVDLSDVGRYVRGVAQGWLAELAKLALWGLFGAAIPVVALVLYILISRFG